LGWFVQNYQGLKIIWHYGLWNTNASLIIKIPEKDIAFIILANHNNLTLPFSLGAGDVTTSVFTTEFLKTFVLTNKKLPDIDYQSSFEDLKIKLIKTKNTPFQDLFFKELFGYARVYQSVGSYEKMTKFFKLYNEIYAQKLPEKFSKIKAIAKIENVTDKQNQVVEFKLEKNTDVQIFSIGEGFNDEMFDYGWIEDSKTQKIVWEMKYSETTHAGGDLKNRKTDTSISLLPGNYKLRYKSDDSHSYNGYNAMPPEIAFYGILIAEDSTKEQI